MKKYFSLIYCVGRGRGREWANKRQIARRNQKLHWCQYMSHVLSISTSSSYTSYASFLFSFQKKSCTPSPTATSDHFYTSTHPKVRALSIRSSVKAKGGKSSWPDAKNNLKWNGNRVTWLNSAYTKFSSLVFGNFGPLFVPFTLPRSVPQFGRWKLSGAG